MRRHVVGMLLAIGTTLSGCSDRNSVDPKYREVSAIPVGLTVAHSPNPVMAKKGDRSGRQYTWVFATSVNAASEPITISEFGCFSWVDGRWVFSNFTGKPFSSKDFVEWYSCPEAKIIPGQTYTDPNNWGGNDVLSESKSLWYFIGLTADGKKVKGEAIVEKLPSLGG